MNGKVKFHLNKNDLERLLDLESKDQYAPTISPLIKLLKIYSSSGEKNQSRATLYRIASNFNHILQKEIFPFLSSKIQTSSLNLASIIDLKSDTLFKVSSFIEFVTSVELSEDWLIFRNLLPTYRSMLKYILIDYLAIVEGFISNTIELLSQNLNLRIDIPKKSIPSICLKIQLSLYEYFLLPEVYKFLINILPYIPDEDETLLYFLNRLSIIYLEEGKNLSSEPGEKSLIQWIWDLETSGIINIFDLYKKIYSVSINEKIIKVLSISLSKEKFPYLPKLFEIASFYSDIFSTFEKLYNGLCKDSKLSALFLDLYSRCFSSALLLRSLREVQSLDSGGYFSHILELVSFTYCTSVHQQYVTMHSYYGKVIFNNLDVILPHLFYTLQLAISHSRQNQDTNKVKSLCLSVLYLDRPIESISFTWEMLDLMIHAHHLIMTRDLIDPSILSPLQSFSMISKAIELSDELNSHFRRLTSCDPLTDKLISFLQTINSICHDWTLSYRSFGLNIIKDNAISNFYKIKKLFENIKEISPGHLYPSLVPIFHLNLFMISLLILYGGPPLKKDTTLRITESFQVNPGGLSLPSSKIENIFYNKNLHLALQSLTIIITDKYNNENANAYSSICNYRRLLASAFSCLSLYYLFLGISGSALSIKKASNLVNNSIKLVPFVDNELAVYISLLLAYKSWLSSKKNNNKSLGDIILKIASHFPGSFRLPNFPAEGHENTPINNSPLILGSMSKILFYHPNVISNSISITISSLRLLLRQTPSNLVSWLLLAEAYFQNQNYYASFKGFARLLEIVSQCYQKETNEQFQQNLFSIGGVLIKMARSLFQSQSFEQSLLFLSQFFPNIKTEFNFIKEDNPFRVPVSIIRFINADQLEELKSLYFQSSLNVTKELLDTGELESLIILLRFLYLFALDSDVLIFLPQLILLTINIYESRAIDQYFTCDRLCELDSLQNLIRSLSLLVLSSEKHDYTRLTLEHLPDTSINGHFFSLLLQIIETYKPSILDADNCKNLLLLVNVFLSLNSIHHEPSLLAWFSLSNSLILFSSIGDIDTKSLIPYIFVILRSLCEKAVERGSLYAADIWFTTGKWLLSIGCPALAQCALFHAMRFTNNEVGLYQLIHL